VINSNLSSISHRYWDTATYWLKIANFPPLFSHLAPSLEWAPSNLWKSFSVSKTRVFQAADGKDLVILVAPFLTDPPVWQTDRQNCDG